MLETIRRLIAAILIGTAILGSAGALQAQQTPPQQGTMAPGTMGQGMGSGMMGQTAMRHHMGMMSHMGMMMQGPMVEGRLAYLKAELAITEAQSAAWNGYVTAVKSRMSVMQGMHQAMMQGMQSGSAVARMDAHIKAMEAMTETLKAIKPATEALYVVLTPDQKQKADLLLGMGCCMM